MSSADSLAVRLADAWKRRESGRLSDLASIAAEKLLSAVPAAQALNIDRKSVIAGLIMELLQQEMRSEEELKARFIKFGRENAIMEMRSAIEQIARKL